MTPHKESAPAPIQRPGFRLRLSPGFALGAEQLGLDRPAGLAKALSSPSSAPAPGGRGDNYLLESPAWGEPVRIRPMRRGGWLGPLLGGRFSSPRRAEREFDTWQSLEQAGAPVPRIALAAAERRGLFWSLFVGTEERVRAVPFDRLIQAFDDNPRALCPWAHAAGASVRSLHEAGALHGDLHPGNLLAEPEGGAHNSPASARDPDRIALGRPRVWLIDLDRAVLCGAQTSSSTPTPGQRMRELMRLDRSLLKTGAAAARHPRVRAAFLAGYCQRDRRLRRALLAHGPREQRRTWLHRFGWAALPGTRRAPKAEGAIPRSTTLLGTLLLGTATLATLLLAGGCDAPAAIDAPSLDPPRLSLLAAGDTGSTRAFPDLFEGQRAVARAMESEDKRRPVDGIVLLGDNFYWDGLSSEAFETRVITNLVEPYCRFFAFQGALGEAFARRCDRAASERHPVPFYAVLGNHDIETAESAELQRREIPKALPNWRMSPGLADAIELGEGVSLVLFESEPAIDEPEKMKAALEAALERARGPWRILALHRPIVTDDDGGVPIGGYPVWVQEAIAASGQPVQLVLAGHHHSLQAILLPEPLRGLHIGAGSGSRTDPPLAVAHPDARFGALSLGFVRIDLLGEGDAARLVVSLVGTARWPILSAVQRPKRLAHFEISRRGEVEQHVP